MKTGLIITGWSMAALLGLVILLHQMGWVWSSKVVFIQEQPKSVVYDELGPYWVQIIRQSTPLGREYWLLVSKQAEPTYGAALRYPETVIDEAQLIKRIQWQPEAIEIELPLDTRLIIPESQFTGGR